MEDQPKIPQRSKAKRKLKKVLRTVSITLGSILLLCVLYNVGRYVNAYNKVYYHPAVRELGGRVTVHFQWYDWFNFSFNQSVEFPPGVTEEQIDAAMKKCMEDAYGDPTKEDVELLPDGTVVYKTDEAEDASP